MLKFERNYHTWFEHEELNHFLLFWKKTNLVYLLIKTSYVVCFWSAEWRTSSKRSIACAAYVCTTILFDDKYRTHRGIEISKASRSIWFRTSIKNFKQSAFINGRLLTKICKIEMNFSYRIRDQQLTVLILKFR
jgi:hypothetical protein